MSAMVGLTNALSLRVGNFADRSDSVKNQWGNSAADEQGYEEARNLTLKVKARNPGNAAVFQPLWFYASNNDDQPAATSLAAQRLALDLRSASAHTLMSVAYFTDGDGAKALKLIEEANALSAARDSDNYLINAGRDHFMLGHDQQAIQMISQAIDINPSLADYWCYVAMAYARQGQIEKARQARDALIKDGLGCKFSDIEPSKSSAETFKKWHASQVVPA
ncbi:MAG: tetratricopeptide repeat protein [Sulfuriferula multivorans]|uniref:Tetratricopeptide repeat protein n=1 Tax=Sulfuriferula multivorans TaxID=1559896 RepID=A0A7C9NTR0_9PROT|nr:tetratricopeptide repeat protein [Sulfuriferula multivorans]